MKQKRSKYTPAVALLALGIAMMVLGWKRGEIAVVLQKAIVICLECIGIG